MTEESEDSDVLRDLQKRTAQLPREIAPPDDAWRKIKAQIDMDIEAMTMRPLSRDRAVWQRPAFLAAAALMLVAAGALSTALLIGRRMTAEIPQVASSTPASPVTSSLAEFTAIENDYISTTNQLQAIIESGRTELAPETIAKLKESLRVIDEAILEARRALATDPGNKTLMEVLSTSYSQKVDLLRRTTEMGQS